jgi:hypothetical protein
MIIARQLHQPCPGDPLGHVAAGVDVDELVPGPVQQQGRHPDGAEQPANVHRTERHDRVVGLGGGHRRQVEHPPPLAKRRVGHLARRQPQHQLVGGVERPVLEARQEPIAVFFAGAPGIVVVAHAGRVRGVGDHRAGPLGVGGGKQQRHPPAQVGAEQRRPLGADGVQDQAEVVHVLLEGLAAGAAVGQAGAEAVQQDEPREGGQLAQEPGHRRLLPLQPQMGGIARHEDQVQLAVAEHLVGELVPVRAAGEADGWAKAHPRSLRGDPAPATRRHHPALNADTSEPSLAHLDCCRPRCLGPTSKGERDWSSAPRTGGAGRSVCQPKLASRPCVVVALERPGKRRARDTLDAADATL